MDPCPLCVKAVMHHYDCDQRAAIEWVRTHPETALKIYQRLKDEGVLVSNTGTA